MIVENKLALNQTRNTDFQNRHQTLWHHSRRQRARRVKRRRKTTHRRPADTVASFEQSLFPKLSTLFHRMFIDFPDHEREDAEQDCLCQSWLAYRKLPAFVAATITAELLAEWVYQAYSSGGRFLALA